MPRRATPMLFAVGSVVLAGALAAALFWPRDGSGPRPLVVYAAAATRPPLEAIARQYQAETGQPVELRFGASEDVLMKAATVNPADPADLFLPADDSYVRMASDRGLVADVLPVATMRAVVLLPPENPRGITAWPDLLREDVKVAVPNPAAAVGKLARGHLTLTGRWAALQPRVVETGNVTEAANASKVGSVDAAVVWDAVAANYSGQVVLTPPELDGVTGRVSLAVLNQSARPDEARRFARYLTAPDRGLKEFAARGFAVAQGGPPWTDGGRE